MSTLRELTTDDRAQWDALAASHPNGGFMQSWRWSLFKELEGYAAIRLGLFREERLRAGMIAFVYPSPAEARLVAAPDGPLLDWDGPEAASDFERLASAALARPECRRAVALRVEPRLESLPPALARCARAPVDLVPEETLELELGPEREMLARMKPKGRYNARLAARRGVEVEFAQGPECVHELYFTLERTAVYQDFLLEPKSFFINLMSALGGDARAAFARYKGITLAAALTVRHGDTETYLYGGHLPLFRETMANYALHWALMRRAAAEGLRRYDLYGYVPAGRPDHPYDRFSRFKEKLGGRALRRIGSRDLIRYDRLAAAAVELLESQPGARP